MSDDRTGLLRTHPAFSEEEKAGIRTALEAMLRSAPFRTSPQCQDLLRYIVLHSLSGEEEELRERIIGIEVFRRRPNYDQAADPVVRIRAADVRKRIALYYESPEGTGHPVRISIPSGSYRACFEFPLSAAGEHPPVHGGKDGVLGSIPVAPSVSSAQVPSEAIASESRSGTWLWNHPLAVAMSVVVLSICLAGGLIQTRRDTSFERFWSPVFRNPNHCLIYVGSNAVYLLSDSFLDRYREEHSLSSPTSGRELTVPLSPNEIITGKDMVPVSGTYVTVGDVAAIVKVASLFSQHRKAFEMRFGEDISVGDLRERPAILIGAFNNSWTLEMTDNLRFVFKYGYQIQDRFSPSRNWKAEPGEQNSTQDYALVSRILSSKTGEMLIAAAGIGQAGTRAAGEFLTNPQAIDAVLKNAPSGWERKNVQIVLHTAVINGSPNPPDVIATYYW